MRLIHGSGSARAVVICIAGLVVVAFSSTSASALVTDYLTDALTVQTGTPPPLDPTTITVKFRWGISRSRMADVTEELGCSTDRVSLYTPGLRTVRIPDGADYRSYVSAYAARSDVEYAEPTRIDRIAFTPNDARYSEQWNFPLIGLPDAWDRWPGGSTSVVVAVLDTGVAYENYSTYIVAPDLAAANFVYPRDIVNGDSHPNDDNQHGTHVCGTIAQQTNNSIGVAGIAWKTSIMPVKTLDEDGAGTHQQFSDGVHWAVDNGAHIISYSGGGSDSTTKHDAAKYAYNNGVLLIAAAGNAATTALDYPAAYDEAMGVAAVDRNKSLAWYSQSGTGLDVSAPGGETSPTASNGVLQNTFALNQPTSMGYYFFQGTSMATPHVSGLAALLWSTGVYTTRAAVKNRIESTCEDLGAAGYDTTFGHGLIDANAALPGGGPTLDWEGGAGYAVDGVDPNEGDPDTTRFRFKVVYTDPEGTMPTRAKLRVQYLDCNDQWQWLAAQDMLYVSGDPATGALFRISRTFGNAVYRYKFYFEDDTGLVATGDPNTWQDAPLIVSPPMLCWPGGSGFGTDGVHPDSGSVGDRFSFRVRYMDSRGDAPTRARVRIKRNGNVIKVLDLVESARGTYRGGKNFRTSVRLVHPGNYQYRFVFRDASGTATGVASNWTSGPVVSGSGASVALTTLAAVPTSAGAQLTFGLSADADVTATVLNVAGRPVRRIAPDQAFTAGTNTLVWDRRSDAGLAVPSGLYLVRLEARTLEGAQSTAMATLSLR